MKFSSLTATRDHVLNNLFRIPSVFIDERKVVIYSFGDLLFSSTRSKKRRICSFISELLGEHRPRKNIYLGPKNTWFGS